MSKTTLPVKDATSATAALAVDNTANVLTPYHLEDDGQRTTLLNAIALLASAAGQTAANAALATIAAKLDSTIAAVNAAATATQPVSASALPLPAGAASSALQGTGNTSLASIDTKLGGTVAVSGPLTNAQLGTAGLATAANQSTGNTSLASILSALGGTLAVSGPLTAAQLTTAALATSALQSAGNASLATIATQTANLATSANQTAGSASIVSAINGAVYYPATQAVSATALPLPNGAATEVTAKVIASADDLASISPSDTVALSTVPKALYVTVAGTLALKGVGGTSVSLGNVSVGQVVPIRARYVMATGTSATVIGLY